MEIKFGSVCSGIEAASVAFEPLGMTAAWLSEIAKHPSAILKKRFPDVKNLGDMTKIEGMIENETAEAPDVLIGGTPCQSFSIAGLRGGLADDRGQLVLSYCKIADSIDRKRKLAGHSPVVTIWENVPGVLSSKGGDDFGCFLSALSGGQHPYRCPNGKKWDTSGYIDGSTRRVAWRVLDAQYWGVAQRRRRVFVVGCAREGGIDPGKVLHDTEAQTNLSEGVFPRKRAGITTSTCGNCGNANSRGITVVSERGWRSLSVNEELRRQGFADGWVDVEGVPISAQYRAIGNSMAVPVIRWLGQRVIAQIDM